MAVKSGPKTDSLSGGSAAPLETKPSSDSASATDGDVVKSSEDVNASSEAESGREAVDSFVQLSVSLPHTSEKVQLTISTHEQVHEIRQSVIDLPVAFQYTCFHLEHRDARVNDFMMLSEIPELRSDADLQLVQDPYTEKEARLHVVRVRELIGAAGDRTDISHGVLHGLSLLDDVTDKIKTSTGLDAVKSFDFDTPAALSTLLPRMVPSAPKTVKTIALSPWNPPPYHLKQKGHLLYLVVTTIEGEQYQITAHVGGFFVNKSSNTKFDPLQRPAPKGHSAHSLLSLLMLISPTFEKAFESLQEFNNRREALATFQISSAIPSSPWIVPPTASPICLHSPDFTRSQESYLIAGVENSDTLRDWNEEVQSAKELPKGSVQDRLFRERLMTKQFADYVDAATRGAVLVARGEIAPLNPTESPDAQIFVYNNVFFSFGADGVGTFTSEGGDEAARIATGKDVEGVRLVNQLDIDGLYTPSTVIVDYLGKRVVGQSIVPGIFKQREPGEHQIEYGGVDGRHVIASDPGFVSTFEQMSRALKVKRHSVWDKEGTKYELEASVETKGLMGTDGRKYVLDLYRITPLDILWLEQTKAEACNQTAPEYPHRMAVMRPELVETFVRYKMRQALKAGAQRRDERPQRTGEVSKPVDDASKPLDKVSKPPVEESKPPVQVSKPLIQASLADSEQGKDSTPSLDPPTPTDAAAPADVADGLSSAEAKEETKLHWTALNPDAFSGQIPQSDDEKAQMEADERDVREASVYIREHAIPDLLHDLIESDISFPMDGLSLSRLLHKRGINVRYIGKIAALSSDPRLSCMKQLCIHDMIARSFKHVSNSYLRHLPVPITSACISHLLNCLLGFELNPHPSANVDPAMRELYHDVDLAFESTTPDSIREVIRCQVLLRYRHELTSNWHLDIRPLQLLRQVSLYLGVQLQARDYIFRSLPQPESAPAISGINGETKKKKRRARDASPVSSNGSVLAEVCTFNKDDIINVIPVVKHSCPRSTLAEEALEAGRLSMLQDQRKLGQDILLESLSLHEQIYGILHPEVARAYNTLSMLYYQIDEKEIALELARKAIIVSERTLGVDSAETLLNYLNLSLFLHQSGDSKAALVYVRHALELWKIIGPLNHPDSITTMNNVAVMLQHVKAYDESRIWFEGSLLICEKVYGKQSINAATLLFQLAQALALDQDSKGAVRRMHESYTIFLNELGPADRNTKEAESWLEQLTQNAVSIAKHAKGVQARRLKVGGVLFVPGAVAASSPVSPAVQIDSRSIDELIRFIEGADAKANLPAVAAAARINPKRRRNAAVMAA